jgi:hypothetical protein
MPDTYEAVPTGVECWVTNRNLPMRIEIHYNRALYKDACYRQITIRESDQYELYVHEGDVIQTEPWSSPNGISAVRFYPTLKAALEDAEIEFDKSVAEGWQANVCWYEWKE